MAGAKNTVTLTFAGDESDLEKSFAKIGKSSKDMADDVEKSSKKVNDSFDRAGEGLDQTYDKFDSLEAVGRGTTDTMSGFAEIMKGNVLQGSTDLAGGIAALADGIGGALVPALKRGVQWVRNLTIVQKALNLVMRLNPIGIVITAITLLVGALVLAYKKSETFRNIVDGAFRAVRIAVSSVVNFFRSLPGWISRAVGSVTNLLTQKGRDIIGGLLGGIKWVWEHTLVGFLVTRRQSILNWIGDASKWLIQKGRDVLSGFWSGLIARWKDVTKWVGGIAKWIKDHKGPVSLDAQLLIPAGKAIMGGFLKGLQSGAGPAWNFVKSVGGKTVEQLRNALSFVAGGFTGGTGSNIDIGRQMAAAYGWTGDQWRALYSLWMKESSWNNLADNPTSTAFGIPQFLNSTAAAYGVLGNTDPRAQIAAGMRYIKDVYGNPMNAWATWNQRSPHWYAKGTPWVPEDQIAVVHKGEAIVPAEVNARRMSGGGGGHFTFEFVGDADMVKFMRENIRVRYNGDYARALGS